MALIVTTITVAQAATIINAFITFISFTTALLLIVLLIKCLSTTTTALAWSSLSRTLHSSLWPTVLRTDSGSGKTEGVVVSILTRLGSLSPILVAIAGIILPLGLSEGPIVQGDFRLVEGTYVPDNSPLALSTTPIRDSFVYGRRCIFFDTWQQVTCLGNDNSNTTTIAPSIVEIFNSTHHGPFSMQFRRFFQGDETLNCSVGFKAYAESFFLRGDRFFADGLLIDMTTESPGIGLWNQTIPTETKIGGTWSQDILWIEPETECVDTNLTVDYFLMDGPFFGFEAEFNLTDHGGFYNLTNDLPSIDPDGQNINLLQHAYKAAVDSNLFAMQFLNVTRTNSSHGFAYPFPANSTADLSGLTITKISVLPLRYLNFTEGHTGCPNFDELYKVNITNVHISCGIFLGPPSRTDGGDPRTFDPGSKWAQGIHACASTTRVSVQSVTFSSNSSTDMQGLQIDRDQNGLDVLWAMEKANFRVDSADPFWGRVDDRYENDSSLWTIRSNRFYVPAGAASLFPVLSPGMPAAAHAHAWGVVYDSSGGIDSSGAETPETYSGQSDYAIKAKLQNLIGSDPNRGNAQIRNLAFTDVLANNIIGTHINYTLLVADHLKTVSYDFRYAIPGFVLLAIWTPSFLLAVLCLLTRAVSFERMRKAFDHTSVGRVVIGTSALRVLPHEDDAGDMPVPQNDSHANTEDGGRGGWDDTVGKTPVSLNIETRNQSKEEILLMETHPQYM